MITPQKIEELFARAGKPDGKYRTDKDQLRYLSRGGAKLVKRRLLGFCGSRSIKSLDEIAIVLFDTRVAQTPEEARELVPQLAELGKADSCTISYGFGCYLSIEEVKNPSGDVKYRVEAFCID